MKFLPKFSRVLIFDSIFHSSAITCFVYPSANRTLLFQERTGNLGAQPVKTHVYLNCFCSSLFFCFVRHFEFSSGLPLYTSSQTLVPGVVSPKERSVSQGTGLKNGWTCALKLWGSSSIRFSKWRTKNENSRRHCDGYLLHLAHPMASNSASLNTTKTVVWF